MRLVFLQATVCRVMKAHVSEKGRHETREVKKVVCLGPVGGIKWLLSSASQSLAVGDVFFSHSST